jgi:hypothetical protein
VYDFIGGFKGALACAGGVTVSAFLVGASYGGILSKTLGPTGFIIGLAGLGGSLVAVPFVTAYGVDRNRIKEGFKSNYALGLAGSLATSALCIGLERLVYSKAPGLSLVAVGASILLIIPAGTALTYRLFGNSSRSPQSSGSLVIMNQGKLALGIPMILSYPSPVMQNQMVTQVSLFNLSF